MKLEANELAQAFDDDELQYFADRTDLSVAQIRQQYTDVISDPANRRHMAFDGEVGEAKQDDCVRYNINVSFFKVLGISGHIEFCGTGASDWSADLHVCLELLGNQVSCRDVQLSPHDAKVCFSPNVGVAKASLCIGIRHGHCLFASGEACYWGFGWHCESFDENIHCF